MSKPEKTQADPSKAEKKAAEKAEGESTELSGEELEAVAGGVLTMSNLQGGSLTSVKQQQITPTVQVDTSIPGTGGTVL